MSAAAFCALATASHRREIKGLPACLGAGPPFAHFSCMVVCVRSICMAAVLACAGATACSEEGGRSASQSHDIAPADSGKKVFEIVDGNQNKTILTCLVTKAVDKEEWDPGQLMICVARAPVPTKNKLGNVCSEAFRYYATRLHKVCKDNDKIYKCEPAEYLKEDKWDECSKQCGCKDKPTECRLETAPQLFAAPHAGAMLFASLEADAAPSCDAFDDLSDFIDQSDEEIVAVYDEEAPMGGTALSTAIEGELQPQPRN